MTSTTTRAPGRMYAFVLHVEAMTWWRTGIAMDQQQLLLDQERLAHSWVLRDLGIISKGWTLTLVVRPGAELAASSR